MRTTMALWMGLPVKLAGMSGFDDQWRKTWPLRAAYFYTHPILPWLLSARVLLVESVLEELTCWIPASALRYTI